MRPRDTLLEAVLALKACDTRISVNEIIAFLYVCENEGLSVQELADRAHTTYQSIWRIERGAQLDPSIALMRNIARALGVGVDHLIAMFGKDDDSELFPAAEDLVPA